LVFALTGWSERTLATGAGSTKVFLVARCGRAGTAVIAGEGFLFADTPCAKITWSTPRNKRITEALRIFTPVSGSLDIMDPDFIHAVPL
jgi:hypothetical protein